jgi:hypothetical protein
LIGVVGFLVASPLPHDPQRRDVTPMRIKVLLTLAAAAVAAAALPALGTGAVEDTKLIAKPMDGDQEVPGPGDDDGKGNAKLKLKPDDGEVCFTIKWKNIADPTAGHIHKGAEGKDGDIVVELFDGMEDESPIKGCAEDVEKSVIAKIIKKPEKYYVNVHNDEFSDGAIRAQLEPADGGSGEDENEDDPKN